MKRFNIVEFLKIREIRYLIYKKRLKSCGERVTICSGTRIQVVKNISIGNNVRIGEKSRLSAVGGIEIGNNVLCSFGVTFLTHDGSVHTCKQYLEKGTQLSNFGRIKIGNNSFIGCNVTILRGVTIGNNCIIGAGSVVTKNVPDGEVWAGNPAKFIKKTEDVAKSYYEKYNTKEQQELRQYIQQHK